MRGHEGAHVPDLLLAPLEPARGMLRNDHLEAWVEGGLDAVHVPPVHRVHEAEHCVHSIASLDGRPGFDAARGVT